MDIIEGWLAGGNLAAFYAAAFILGAFHALEPGHGKTVVAAYLVGSKGRVYEAVLLGAIVTFTHTFSIIVLAVIAKYAATSFTDAELHTYLGLVAAVLILGVGLWMMYNRLVALRGGHAHGHHSHSHDSGHSHSHHSHGGGHEHHHHSHEDEHGHGHHHHSHGEGHSHSQGHAPVLEHEWEHRHIHSHGPFGHSHHHPKPGERITLWSLFALGISGGLVPCPAAFALLLAAVSAGALAKGLSLVLVFSLGLAATLVAIGIGVVKAAGFAGRFMNTERVAPYVALASAVLVTLIGVATLVNSVKHLV